MPKPRLSPRRTTSERVFLFLQGPHGPFFGRLGRQLEATGAGVLRVGFNAGDQVFWPNAKTFLAHPSPLQDWPETIDYLFETRFVSDLVIYGDMRPVHAIAIAAARSRGITVHVFEEGYLRPYWITYERDGSNGNSRLMDLSIEEMRTALAETGAAPQRPPAHWGDMRRHMLYGALYHGCVLAKTRSYPHFTPHRSIPVQREFQLHLSRLLMQPVHALQRGLATHRIRQGHFPYHLVLLQLEHDSNFRAHSPFSSMLDFVSDVVAGFAAGAPRHHHLVFKAHPLEDGRVPLRRTILRLARAAGISERVHVVGGSRLAPLLDEARAVVTVNSTAGQQALWRNLPVRAFGRAVYDKPELVSHQPLPAFFADPVPPDAAAYADYRRFLLATSQVPGGFYARGSRNLALRRITDMMLSPTDPYETLLTPTAAQEQQLRLIQ